MNNSTKKQLSAILIVVISLLLQVINVQPVYAQQDSVPKMTMEVLVMDYDNNPRQGEEITFVDTLTHTSYTGVTNENGRFVVHLPGGTPFLVKIAAIGKEQRYQTFRTPQLQRNQQYGKSLYTIKYEPPKVITLDNVYFDVNKASLRQESYAELKELLEYLERRKKVRIEIAGHTDNTGEEEANLRLSQRRAESVKQYLVRKGIDPSRIVAKGYGESQPVAMNNTKEGRQKNRRTEVRIIKEQ